MCVCVCERESVRFKLDSGSVQDLLYDQVTWVATRPEPPPLCSSSFVVQC